MLKEFKHLPAKARRELNSLYMSGSMDLEMIRNLDMKERDEVIKKHKYAIWQNERGQWCTTYYEEGKRKKKKTKDKEKLLEFVFEYVSQEMRENAQEYSIKDLYPEFMEYKRNSTNNPANILRIQTDWKKYYLPYDEFISMPIEALRKADIHEWINLNVKKFGLTCKTYNNMMLIIRGILDLCTDEKYDIIERNIAREIRAPKNLLRVQRKGKPEDNVYTKKEVEMLKEQLWTNYRKRKDIVNLGVVFALLTGLRVGELCCIKFEDIEDVEGDRVLRLSRSAIRTVTYNEQNVAKESGYEVQERLKANKDERLIPLSKECLDIIHEAKKCNFANKEPNNSYVFIRNGDFVRPRYFGVRLKTACKNLGIKYRSMHKLRKTFITCLLANGVALDTTRSIVGHSSSKVTYDSYDYDQDERKVAFDKVRKAIGE